MNRDTARPLPRRTIRTDPPSRWADHLQVALAQNQGNEWSPQSATVGGVGHRMSHQRKVHGSVTGAGNSWGWGGPTIVRRWPVSSAGRTRWIEAQARWPRAISTARSFSSGGCLFDDGCYLSMTPTFSRFGASW